MLLLLLLLLLLLGNRGRGDANSGYVHAVTWQMSTRAMRTYMPMKCAQTPIRDNAVYIDLYAATLLTFMCLSVVRVRKRSAVFVLVESHEQTIRTRFAYILLSIRCSNQHTHAHYALRILADVIIGHNTNSRSWSSGTTTIILAAAAAAAAAAVAR